ncbi:unnamed protein product, partial [Amoebophrya sp. A120]
EAADENGVLYSPRQRTTEAMEGGDVQEEELDEEQIAGTLARLSISSAPTSDNFNTGPRPPPAARADSLLAEDGDGPGRLFLGRNSVWQPHVQAAADFRGGHSRGALIDPAARDGQQHQRA